VLRLKEEENVPKPNKALRARVVSEEAINKMQKPWVRETLYDIVRNEALLDLLKDFDCVLPRHRKYRQNFGIKKKEQQRCCQKCSIWAVSFHQISTVP